MIPEASNDDWHDVDQRMALAREWNNLVAEVRTLPGFEDFLCPPSLQSLLPAASNGPVVIINVSQWRCDALIIKSGGVQVVELCRLTLAGVIDRVTFYLDTVERFQAASLIVQAAVETFLTSAQSAEDMKACRWALDEFEDEQVDMEQRLGNVLAWCWDTIAEPVLSHLGITHPPESTDPLPRLWWCPTGPLTLLPLHAAGRDDIEGAAVIDRVVSSYTPTIRALLGARRPRPETEASVRDALLVVAMPDTPDQPSLPNVHREVGSLAALPIETTIVQGPDATIAAVSAAMTTHRWVHFSCHGDQNLIDPSQGGLLLSDGTLTVMDTSSRQYHGDLAFLSACKTATGGATLPDEAITLAAALHHTGYRHVIATLWSIWDDSAAEVTEAVYRAITDGTSLRPEHSAHALHNAVRSLRAAEPGRPSAWIPFTHTGP